MTVTLELLGAVQSAGMRAADAAWLCGVSEQSLKRLIRQPLSVLAAVEQVSRAHPGLSASAVLPLVQRQCRVSYDVVYHARRIMGLSLGPQERIAYAQARRWEKG